MIKNVTRGHITFEFEGRQVTIYGEALLPRQGSPDFVVFLESIKKWDPPYEAENINPKTRDQIISKLFQEAKEINLKLETE